MVGRKGSFTEQYFGNFLLEMSNFLNVNMASESDEFDKNIENVII